MRACILPILLFLGCGGTEHPAEHHESTGGGEHHEALPPALDAFHEILAPLWHAEAGEERTDRTCSAMDSFRTRAEAVRSSPPPPAAESDSAGWQSAADALGGSVDALAAACAADGRPAFAESFERVHEAFHALVERSHPQ